MNSTRVDVKFTEGGQMSEQCQVEGCSQAVSKPGHLLCYHHWKQDKAGKLSRDQVADSKEGPGPDESDDGERLSSTKLGKHFSLSATRMNLLLAELGWVEKFTKGWKPTARGLQFRAEAREIRRNGVPYVVWPATILTNKILLEAVADAQGNQQDEASSEVTPDEKPTRSNAASFRERFPARFRATDGHMVRSRAEMLIDNWLYMQGIVHAVERKLPIEEDVYCDFYLPTGKVYIEYWGLENDPKYAARKADKQAIYERYGLNLVDLVDDDIMGLDDVLPRLLLKFGIDCT
jgi:hypothetical protein